MSDAGFFVFPIPTAHHRRGHRPLRVALLDGKGAFLKQQRLPTGR